MFTSSQFIRFTESQNILNAKQKEFAIDAFEKTFKSSNLETKLGMFWSLYTDFLDQTYVSTAQDLSSNWVSVTLFLRMIKYTFPFVTLSSKHFKSFDKTTNVHPSVETNPEKTLVLFLVAFDDGIPDMVDIENDYQEFCFVRDHCEILVVPHNLTSRELKKWIFESVIEFDVPECMTDIYCFTKPSEKQETDKNLFILHSSKTLSQQKIASTSKIILIPPE